MAESWWVDDSSAMWQTNGAPNYRVFRLMTNGVMDDTLPFPGFLAVGLGFMTIQPGGKLLASLS